MTLSIETILQMVIGLGLLNVWLVRAWWQTPYRGGEARSLREEFAEYGLPDWSFFAIGTAKIGAAIFLLAGIWVPSLVLPAVCVVLLLMLGALAMHLKVGDPPRKSLPAFLMLLLSASLCVVLLA